ncbi:MAG: RHS repeat-associated core domain-containing protein, partial [Planctomycetota bacterium]
GSALQESAATINDSTAYTISVTQRQRTVDVTLSGQSSALSYGSSTDFGMGKSGMYSDKTGVKFDNFKAIDALSTPPAVPRIGGSADVSLSSGQLLVNGATRGGEAVVEKFTGGDYLVQVVVDQNGGTKAEVWIHYQDSNNGYKVEFLDSEIWLKKVVKGQWTTIRAFAGGGAVNQTVQVRWSYPWPYRRITVYVEGVQQFYEDDSTFTTGGVALGGTSALFDNLKIGTSADNDLDDVGDTIFVDESFGSTDTTVTYDKAGNLIDDGSLQYVYDAWNRLVKVRSSKQGNAVILTAEFDGIGRRIEKVVTNTGTFDATWRYFYDGQKIVETRNGSGNMVQQFIHGTRYIDELIQMRLKDKGDLYVHQDANWNVIALTDLGGSVVERYVYKPYGEVTVHQDTGYGDRDGDGDVDSTDKGTVGSTCTGTVSGACRILDLDFDGDYDSTDATKFDALTQGSLRTPGLKSSSVNQPFAHQGLLFEPEIGSYQNRPRQYLSNTRKFAQRDSVRFAIREGLYEYAKSSPINLLDPTGRSAAQPGACSQLWCGEVCSQLGPNCDKTIDQIGGAAVSVCCTYFNTAEGPFVDPVLWKVQTCTGNLYNSYPADLRACTDEHEAYHRRTMGCACPKCSPLACGWQNRHTHADQECEAYKRTYNCLVNRNSTLTYACNVALCIARQLCNSQGDWTPSGGDAWSYNLAIQTCGVPNPPDGGGCAGPVLPTDGQ